MSLLLALLGGCATERYFYVPAAATGATGDHGERTEATYKIPAQAPAGSVRVTSDGVFELKPTAGGDKIRALHVKLVVSNQESDVAWTVDPQQQKVSFPNEPGQTAPLFAKSGDSVPPDPNVKRGELKSFDLYYALPKHERSESDVPTFDFRWQVKTATELATQTTSFNRMVAPRYAPLYPPTYYGPYFTYPYGYYPYGAGLGMGFGWEPPLIYAVPTVPSPPPSKPVIVGH